MASPITWNLVADCGLKVELQNNHDFSKWRRFPNTYSLTPPHFLHFKNPNDSRLQNPFEGKLSSIHRVTVPKGVRKKAEIPKDATYFCFMHPPRGLAALVNWEKHKSFFSKNAWKFQSAIKEKDAGQLFAILLGAYIYFDSNQNLLRVNALSFMKTENKLNFSGPWNITKDALNTLISLERFEEIHLDSFAEGGLVSWAWVTPSESFGSHSLCVDEKQSYKHGSMVFLREDGTAFAYHVVDLSNSNDPTGRCEMVQDCFYAVKDCILFNIDPITTTISREDLVNIDCWKNLVAKAKEDKQNIDYDFYHHAKDETEYFAKQGKSLLHLACHADLSVKEVRKMLKEEGKSNLHSIDNFGFTPLHYACRFASKNFHLINWLVDNFGDAVQIPDAFNRLPLYLACAGQASKDVIALLVEKYPQAITVGTKTMGITPLHIACFNQATREVISVLLEGSKHTQTLLLTRTLSQKLPIHFAIESRMDVDAIDKLLQNKDTTLATYNNMLPLHMACRNNSSPDIVQLLLDMDPTPEKDSLQHQDGNDMKPIHYAVNKTNADARIVKLLLEHYVEENQLNYSNKMACNDHHKFDKHMSPLWLACKESAPHEVIELLMSQPNVRYWEFSSRADQQMLSSIIFDNKKLQNLLIRKLAERCHFVRLNFRFTVNGIMLVVFLLIIEELPNGQPEFWHVVTILSCSAVITADEAIQLLFRSGISYFTDPQNFYEVGTLAVVLSSILNIGECKLLRTDDSCSVNLYLLLLVVVFLTLNIISYARTVFLPFSEFYTGLVTIIQALAPFFSVTALIIVAFTASYRLLIKYEPSYENAYPDCGRSFRECIISFVLHGFFEGLDNTEKIPDILFGVFITVILLNVSIAIVSNSWSEAQKYARRNVWVHRIAFLSQSGYLIECMQNLFIFKAIDNFRYVPLKSRVTWQQDPILKNVCTRDQYENPKDYFEEHIAKTILESHSLDQSLHWIRVETKSKTKTLPCWSTETTWKILFWLVHNAIYFILVIIGISTFGLLSPEDFRIWFF
jgi:ankyrin repeat protein